MESSSVIFLIVQLVAVIGIFAVLAYVSNYIVKKIYSMPSLENSKFLNPVEYFPHEQVLLLKQVFYLIMILVFLMIDLYLIFDMTGSQYIYVSDIIISIYLLINLDKKSSKDKIILFLLIPFGSITNLLFGPTLISLLDVFHIIGYIYFMGVYYRKFVKYTENNGLGITIMLLYTIVLVSFLFTMLVEEVTPLDSIVMVTNAFTSNSFDPAGNSVIGKVDSLVLAWGGFMLSGVGTATLSVSMIRRYIDREFDEMEDLIKNKKK
ncbi:hypothetical protein PXD04_07710 [Methanosphaera sp. ISO3-F5]|uniref:hypothetical protein n=1 Tax=Methanosphaera sp. ISO3-F5 TaxID=1452353 RepID=UPI002B26252E|nr:hypothetical protein [Methanosphaera sp. ISO3-F5]WQH63582.1 hypothetical protein PXD04_07710 [Methanosphaera sp. ISO3-F5]